MPALALLMIAQIGLLLGGLRANFVTVDEVGHVPAGVANWEIGDFALYRVNPPLTRMLAALPVLAARPTTDYRHLERSPDARSDWEVGRDFARANAPRYFDLICLGRLATVSWSLLGTWIIYCWGSDLYGRKGGLFGAAIWCFEPTVLSFSELVVPDIPTSVAGLVATYAFWRYLRAPSWGRAAIAGILLGVAELTKFSLLALYGIWPLLWLIHRMRRPGDGARRGSWGTEIAHGLLIVMLSIDVINLGYGFRETFRPLGDFSFVSRSFGGEPPPDAPDGDSHLGNRFRDSWLGAIPVPVPAEFLRGIDVQRKDFEGRFPSYLEGEWSNHGWWYYYLVALAVKVPLGTWALVLWGIALSILSHPASARREDELTLLIPAAAILALVSSQTGFNHHMRYILPIFPFLAVATGKLAYFLRRDRLAAGGLVLALFAWSIASMLRVYPHTLSYFNEAVGGPERGHDHIIDSNIDWGQDLFALKDWVDRHPEARPMGLAYFHFLDPLLFGIEYRLPPPGLGVEVPEGWDAPAPSGPQPGYYALSVNYLRGITFHAPNGYGGRTSISTHDYFAYFQRFQPIARAGYSIYIYHITAEQAAEARKELGLPPLPAGEAQDPHPVASR